VLEGSKVVVVVPAFREEALVAQVVQTMPRFVDAIVLVDDGSPDRTGDNATAVGDPRLVVERHPERRGVGAALTTGYRRALALTSAPTDAIAVMAGDAQMLPEELASVVLPIARGAAEYVKGDRFGDPAVRRSMGLPRWIGGQVFSRLTSLAVGQRISDSQCGFTALSRGAVTALDLDGLWPGFGYPNDLLGQLAARGLRVTEVPVSPKYGDEVSKLRLRHLPPIFWLIGRAALRRRAGRVTPAGDAGAGGLRNGQGVSS
jgi:glycosyltransferase involved in cell wall biosynthesis